MSKTAGMAKSVGSDQILHSAMSDQSTLSEQTYLGKYGHKAWSINVIYFLGQ